MRQSDLCVGATKRRCDELIVAFAAPFICGEPHEVVAAEIKQAMWKDEHSQLLNWRTRHTRYTKCKVNALFELELITKYCSKKEHVGALCDTLGWDVGKSCRNNHFYDKIKACCIRLPKLATSMRWFQLKTEFGVHWSRHSDVFGR